MADEPLMKVGEVAKRTNRSVRALRLYEEHGLLEPAARTDGGFRLYGPDAVRRIDWIEKLQDMGFSLAQVEEILSLTGSDVAAPEAMHEIRRLLTPRLDDTRKRVERLLRLERDLSDTIAYLLECRPCNETHLLREVCSTCEQRHPGRHERSAPTLVSGMQSDRREQSATMNKLSSQRRL